ncbi:MAG: hypothetical protein ACJ8BW_26745 [Ktedonobacteraceae bacterium]
MLDAPIAEPRRGVEIPILVLDCGQVAARLAVIVHGRPGGEAGVVDLLRRGGPAFLKCRGSHFVASL